MPNECRRAVAALSGAAISALTLPAVLGVATAEASPLPGFCQPSMVVDNVCTARLAAVTADTINGTITGAPVGGGAAVTLAGPMNAYLKSTGFGDSLPAPVQRWDSTIDSVSGLALDSSDPNSYGNAKSVAFLPRTLNDLATQFPPGIVVVRFTPDDAQPGTFRLVSIQPTPR